MFYDNREMGCIIKGVYLVKGEKTTAWEKGRTHTAISLRIKGNSLISFGEEGVALRDGTVAYFPAGLDYRRDTLDGEEYITFNIVALNESKKEILVAVTNRGKISHVTYDLFEDKNGFYFEYGCDYTKVNINEFKEIKDEY